MIAHIYISLTSSKLPAFAQSPFYTCRCRAAVPWLHQRIETKDGSCGSANLVTPAHCLIDDKHTESCFLESFLRQVNFLLDIYFFYSFLIVNIYCQAITDFINTDVLIIWFYSKYPQFLLFFFGKIFFLICSTHFYTRNPFLSILFVMPY